MLLSLAKRFRPDSTSDHKQNHRQMWVGVVRSGPLSPHPSVSWRPSVGYCGLYRWCYSLAKSPMFLTWTVQFVPVLWAAQWSLPPAWSPCWTCPATACPPPAGWSKRRCWLESDNCRHCSKAEMHLPLNGEKQQEREQKNSITQKSGLSTINKLLQVLSYRWEKSI